MIFLNSSPAETLQVVLGEAIATNNLTVRLYYEDFTTTSSQVSGAGAPFPSSVNTNGTTAVNVVSAPSHDSRRVGVSVLNNDTISHTVIFQIHGATTFALISATLPVGSTLQEFGENGWQIFPSSGGGSVPTATTSSLGVVQPDGSTIDISSGIISVPTATTSSLGLVQPDGSTITISAGVISAAGGLAIGDAVGSGTAGCVLFVDSSGNLADSSFFTCDSAGNVTATSLTTSAGNLTVNGALVVSGSGIQIDSFGDITTVGTIAYNAATGGSPPADIASALNDIWNWASANFSSTPW